jgi:hypothetical protein
MPINFLHRNRVRILLTIAFCVLLLQSDAQQNLNLLSFRGQLTGQNRYQLSFSLIPGFTCSGINIERSNDSIHYTSIGKIEGTCGNLNTSVSYTFDDLAPKENVANYYRLQLGTTGNPTAPIKFVYLVYNKDGFTVLQDAGSIKIYLTQGNNSRFAALLYNLQGQAVYQSLLSNNYLQISKTGLVRGLYVLIIQKENQPVYKQQINIF